MAVDFAALTRDLLAQFDTENIVWPSEWLGELTRAELFFIDGVDAAPVPFWTIEEHAEEFCVARGIPLERITSANGRVVFGQNFGKSMLLDPDDEISIVIPPQLVKAVVGSHSPFSGSVERNDYLEWVIAEKKAGRELMTWIIDASIKGDVFVIMHNEPNQPPVPFTREIARQEVMTVFTNLDTAWLYQSAYAPGCSIVKMGGALALQNADRMEVDRFGIDTGESVFEFDGGHVSTLLDTWYHDRDIAS